MFYTAEIWVDGDDHSYLSVNQTLIIRDEVLACKTDKYSRKLTSLERFFTNFGGPKKGLSLVLIQDYGKQKWTGFVFGVLCF
jgi:hypothetical protein